MGTAQRTSKDFSDLETLVERAEMKRDAYSIAQLRRFAENHPSLFQITDSFTKEVHNRLIHYICSGNIDQKVQLKRNIEELMAQLIDNRQADVLSQLMCHEVTTAFLFMKYMDTMITRHIHDVNAIDIRMSDFASARFSRAIKTLHRLRSILPDIQLNLNQINIKNQDSCLQEKLSYQTLEDTNYEKF